MNSIALLVLPLKMPKVIHILNLGNTFHKNCTQKTHAIVFKPDLFLYSKLSKKKKRRKLFFYCKHPNVNCLLSLHIKMSCIYTRKSKLATSTYTKILNKDIAW